MAPWDRKHYDVRTERARKREGDGEAHYAGGTGPGVGDDALADGQQPVLPPPICATVACWASMVGTHHAWRKRPREAVIDSKTRGTAWAWPPVGQILGRLGKSTPRRARAIPAAAATWCDP